MEASPAQRRIAFAAIVFALVALGAYMLRTTAHGTASLPGHPAAARVSARSPAPGAPSARPTPSPSGQADIYQWLPFTQQGLATAAATVVRFGDAYGTFSYTENAAAYIRPMQSLVSPALAGQLGAAFAAPGVAAVRTSSKQVSSGTAAIESIRAFGPDSLTFVVQVKQQQTDDTGHRQSSTAYAVTVTGNGTSWQVSAIELAAMGNS